MKRLIFIIVIFAFAALCVACMDVHEEVASPSPSVSPDVEEVEEKSSSIQPEEYRVYSVIIEYLGYEFYAHLDIHQAIIKDVTATRYSSTTLVDSLDYVLGRISEIDGRAVQDFREKNQKSYYLKRNLDIEIDYEFISENEVDAIFSEGLGWNEFYDKYPTSFGIVTLSRVGFNSEKDQALIYFSNTHWMLDGFGFFALLSFDGETWLIEQMEMVWIS